MHPILNFAAPELYIAFAMFLLAMWLRRYRPNLTAAILRQALRVGSILARISHSASDFSGSAQCGCG